MATWDDFSQVSHDVFGIGRHLDRETGKLEGFFHPRFALPEAIQPGEKVSYTVCCGSGGGFHFSSREGTLVRIVNDDAQVKAKNGRLLWVVAADLRRVVQPNAMTEAFLKARDKMNATP